MKIGFVSAVGGAKETPMGSMNQLVDGMVRENLKNIKNPDTEIVFQMTNRITGIIPNEYSYLKLLEDAEVLHSFIKMETSEKCDAVVIWCFLDPIIKEVRQALDIPVIGIAETAMFAACMMGNKFGIVAPGGDPSGQAQTDAYIKKLGLESRAVPTRTSEFTDEFGALQDGTEGVKAFTKVARELIADGAEVIIPGCVLSDVMLVKEGIREIDGVPVLNVGALAIKTAEMFADLKNKGMLWISRTGMYNRLGSDPMLSNIANTLLEYSGPGFWKD